MDLNSLVDYVHFAETTNGTNTNPYALHNYCKGLGKSNEYGYGGMQSMYCFANHDQATARVAEWFEEHGDLTVAEQLCVYNTGRRECDCQYYRNYLSWTGR